jgi:DNA-damage-inducible protein D
MKKSLLKSVIEKGDELASELTRHNVIEKDLKGSSAMSKERVDNNVAVRKMLKERGVQPEQLPTTEQEIKRNHFPDIRKMVFKSKN